MPCRYPTATIRLKMIKGKERLAAPRTPHVMDDGKREGERHERKKCSTHRSRSCVMLATANLSTKSVLVCLVLVTPNFGAKYFLVTAYTRQNTSRCKSILTYLHPPLPLTVQYPYTRHTDSRSEKCTHAITLVASQDTFL